MNGVNWLLGPADPCRRPLGVYAEAALACAEELSRELLRVPGVRNFPDVVSFAFWCRRANLSALRAGLGPEVARRLGRGLAFHITPSNVPVNFAFSWLFSLLAGNANRVRVPSRPFPQVDMILRALKVVLEHHPEIASRSVFLTYPVTPEITAAFSAEADARIIWCGDETVAAVRSLPCRPRCVDLVFPDRYSVAILDGPAVTACDGTALAELARRFYNDTYLIDQNACSSPQLLLWHHASEDAKRKFWTAVGDEARERYPLAAAVAVDKYEQSCRDAMALEAMSGLARQGNWVYRVALARLPAEGIEGLRGRCGYFYEYDLASWDELGAVVTERFQTVTYFGIDAAALADEMVSGGWPGVDRIVPVGRALDIGPVWDGYDVIRMLSRVVDVV